MRIIGVDLAAGDKLAEIGMAAREVIDLCRAEHRQSGMSASMSPALEYMDVAAGKAAMEAAEASAWRDIKTAPKDRDVLLWQPGHRVVVGCWRRATGRASDIGGAWYSAYYGVPFATAPTMWAEIPAPPGLRVAP